MAAGIGACLAVVSLGASPRIVFAHRGASGYLPEHDFAAKAMAHGQGADYLEQDIVLTKDNVPIILHDIHLDTVTDVARKFPSRKRADGRYYAIDFTLAEIRQLNATQRFDLKTGKSVWLHRFPLANYTYRLHTLEEEILFIEGLNISTGRGVGLFPEIKKPTFHRNEGRDIARVVYEVLRRFGYDRKSSRCLIQCFEQTTLRRFREEFGWQGHLALVIGGNKPGEDGTDYTHLSTPAGMKEVAAFADAIIPSPNRLVSWDDSGRLRVSDFARDGRAAGLIVYAGAISRDALPPHCPSWDALHAALFEGAGVSGVCSDFTDLTVQWLAAHPLP